MVTVDSKLDKKTFIDYFTYDSITQDYKFKMAMIIAIVCVAGAFVLDYFGYAQYRATAIIFGILMVVIWVLQFFMRMYDLVRKSALNRSVVNIKYEFNEKKIVWMNKTTNKHGACKWEDVKKVRNNGKYMYIYVSKTHAMALNTEYITQGTPEELRELAKKGCKNYR